MIVIFDRTSQNVPNAVLLVRQNFVEHVSCTGLQVERVVWLVQNLLVFLGRTMCVLTKILTSNLEAVNEHFYLLFRADKSFDFAYSGRVLLADVNGHFDGSHVSF